VRRDRALLAISLLSALVGCAQVVSTSRPTARSRTVVVVEPRETEHCLRAAVGHKRADEDWPAEPAPAELAESLTPVPDEVRRVARAAGLEPLLAQLLSTRDAEGGVPFTPAIATKRMQAIARLSSVEIELTAVLFEADCIGDQMEAVMRELERRQHRQEIGIAISSVVVGAVAGIGAGIIDLSGHTPAAIGFGIAGGATSAALGLGAFAKRRDRVVFDHERNLLAPIMTGADPDHLFPTFVFYMITHGRPGERPPREEMIASWRTLIADHVPAERRATAEAVLFGPGGTYDARLVHVREQMFDVMESHLSAIEGDLELLYTYVASLLLHAASGE